MKKFKFVGIILLAAILIGGAMFGYDYYYTSTHFISTENAQITAKTYTITPLVPGKILNWFVAQGDFVDKDQIIGRQENAAYIKSPIAGQIVVSNPIKDQVVAPSMTLATISDINNMYVKVNIEETAIPLIHEGQEAQVKIDAFPNVDFVGYVSSMDLASQQAFSSASSFNTSGTFTKVTQLIPIKITLTNADGYAFKLGMNAKVKIRVK